MFSVFDGSMPGVDELEETVEMGWEKGHVIEHLTGHHEELGFYPE